MIKNSEVSHQVQLVKDGLDTLNSHIWLGDLGVRAYIIKQTSEFLNPYVGARDSFNDNLISLGTNLNEIGFDLS